MACVDLSHHTLTDSHSVIPAPGGDFSLILQYKLQTLYFACGEF